MNKVSTKTTRLAVALLLWSLMSLVLIVGKIIGLVSYGWWTVLAPIWGPWAAVLVGFTAWALVGSEAPAATR